MTAERERMWGALLTAPTEERLAFLVTEMERLEGVVEKMAFYYLQMVEVNGVNIGDYHIRRYITDIEKRCAKQNQ